MPDELDNSGTGVGFYVGYTDTTNNEEEDDQWSVKEGGHATEEKEGPPAKKKIRRVRPLRSCVSCNKRKIKCDRAQPACGPCCKRGEADQCSLGAGQPGLQSSAAILERLHQLEARVDELEASSVHHHDVSIHKSALSITTSGLGDSGPQAMSAVMGQDADGTMDGVNQNDPNGLPEAYQQPNARYQSHPQAQPPLGSHQIPHWDRRQDGNVAHYVDESNASSNANGSSTRHGKLLDRHYSLMDDTALNDGTEEAALVLESLCNSSSNLKALQGAVANNGSTRYPTPSLSPGNDASGAGKSTIFLDPLRLDSSSGNGNSGSPTGKQIKSTAPASMPPLSMAAQHLSQQASATQARILSSPFFPTKDFSDHLIANYFRYLDVYWHVHINYLFENEYQDFWKLKMDVERDGFTGGTSMENVDPAWIALYLVTLALGLQVTQLPLPSNLSVAAQYPDTNDLLALSDIWINDAEDMLKAAQWSRKYQFRTLQAIILLNAYQCLSSLTDPMIASWNAAAIRIAQLMGLHALDDANLQNISDDPAVPPGNNAIKTQLAKRIWLSLMIMEHVYTSRMGLSLPLASNPYSTPLPLNVNDSDLTLAPESTLAAKPNWTYTSTSSLLFRWTIVKVHRRLSKMTAEVPPGEAYTHVLAIDSELRKWLSEAPADPLPSEANDYDSYKSATWRQWAVISEIHGELLHLHRPYMVRGYTDARYSLSTKSCLESAKLLCETRKHLKDSPVDERFWWTGMRWLSAAIVIFIDLFQAMDAGCSEEVLQMKKAEIPTISSIFQARQNSPYSPVRKFAGAASRVIENLTIAEKKKHAAATSRKKILPGMASNANQIPSEEDESVGRVFQRIARNMAVADSSPPRASSYSVGSW